MVPDWLIFPSVTSLFSEPIQAFRIWDILWQGSSISCGEARLLFALNLHLSSFFWGPLSFAIRRMASHWPQLSLHLIDIITYSLIQLSYDLLLLYMSFHIFQQLSHFSAPSSPTNLLLKREIRVVHIQDVGKLSILISVPLLHILITHFFLIWFWLCLTAQL